MEDIKFMRRCIALAKKGLGYTYPNPLVGCVIVYRGKIISEGWHKKAGAFHAEKEAIEKIQDKSILKASTLYVNLEPCNHFGKTPPCSDLIVKMKIPKVVIGSVDFNQKVYGQGIKKLKAAGCEVVTGILEEECIYLNRRFFTFHQKKRPYIILKWAESKDGFIAPKNPNENYWLTNKLSRQLVHQWRSEEQAIMIGVKTAINDDPKLNTRLWFGNDPVPIVIDPNNRLPLNSYLRTNKKNNQLIQINLKKSKNKSQNFRVNGAFILEVLYDYGVQSVIVEGGAETLRFFIVNNFWDEVKIFKTNQLLVDGISAPDFSQKENSIKKIEQDRLFIYHND